ncbi:MAG: sigma-70 family RNA polymerase sigma factor [Deltaproteobacteria bacterium]|nr:MAG: sigma-70 family RNA polymerase sigma factor [Deltaproteobacteria bacterium]
MDDDVVMLQRWRDGDRRAGEELCARYFDEVYRFFVSDADDLTQQTFLACVKARNQFVGLSTFRTYLFSIARNQLYTRLRQLPKAEHVDLEVSSLNELVSSPSGKLREHQEVAQVRAAMGQLPVDQQVLLELHYWHDLDATALADVFEASPGTIRVRLLRARRTLRGLLELGVTPNGGDDRLSSALREPDVDSDDR